jgi:hypothetical protein
MSALDRSGVPRKKGQKGSTPAKKSIGVRCDAETEKIIEEERQRLMERDPGLHVSTSSAIVVLIKAAAKCRNEHQQ